METELTVGATGGFWMDEGEWAGAPRKGVSSCSETEREEGDKQIRRIEIQE